MNEQTTALMVNCEKSMGNTSSDDSLLKDFYCVQNYCRVS